MESADIWSTIHAERRALADDLANLTDAQWQTPSLCDRWSVRDVLAHMTGTAVVTFPTFAVGLIGSGLRIDTMFDRIIARYTTGPPADTLAAFEAHMGSTTAPVPGSKKPWLGEVLVHSEDIRRPLGIAHTYSADALAEIADFRRKSSLSGSKKRAAGLTFRATDAGWSSGEGPEVTGPGVSLLLAISGRAVALADLSGPGLATLQGRME